MSRAVPALSVVVPAYNEEENVAALAAAVRDVLAKAGYDDYELIFVDDGSQDATTARVRAAARQDPGGRVRLLRLAENGGESAATEAGCRRARGEIVVLMDCDLQNPPEDIPRLLEPLKRGEADCVCGVRLNRRAGDSAYRQLQSRIANGIRNALSGESIRDSGCTFRALRRECLTRVKIFKGMHRFLPTLVRLEGYRVMEVPVGHRPRLAGQSKYGMWDRAFAALYDLFAVRWMRSRVVRWTVVEDSAALPEAAEPDAADGSPAIAPSSRG